MNPKDVFPKPLNPFKPVQFMIDAVRLNEDNVREIAEFMNPYVDDIFQTVNGDSDLILCFRNQGEEDYKIAEVGNFIVVNDSDDLEQGFYVMSPKGW